MDEQRWAQLKSLTPEERSKRLNEGLQRRREERNAKARLQGMETWLAELSSLCEAADLNSSHLTIRVGGKVVEAMLVEDFNFVFEWMADHFPHGSTIWWSNVSAAKIIPIAQLDGVETVRSAFEKLSQHVHALDEDRVYVLEHHDYGSGNYRVAFEMAFLDCKNVLDVLLGLRRGELYIASLEGNWLMEYDPFDDECSGARVER